MSALSTEKVFLVDPYDEKHMEMIREFEERQQPVVSFASRLEELRHSVSKDEYDRQKKEKNEIEESLFLEKNSKILGVCHIYGEKDIKLVKMNIFPTKTKENVRKCIPYFMDFVFKSENVEEVFLMIDPKDKETLQYLESQNYECLGEEKGEILYLREKEMMNERQRTM